MSKTIASHSAMTGTPIIDGNAARETNYIHTLKEASNTFILNEHWSSGEKFSIAKFSIPVVETSGLKRLLQNDIQITSTRPIDARNDCLVAEFEHSLLCFPLPHTFIKILELNVSTRHEIIIKIDPLNLICLQGLEGSIRISITKKTGYNDPLIQYYCSDWKVSDLGIIIHPPINANTSFSKLVELAKSSPCGHISIDLPHTDLEWKYFFNNIVHNPKKQVFISPRVIFQNTQPTDDEISLNDLTNVKQCRWLCASDSKRIESIIYTKETKSWSLVIDGHEAEIKRLSLTTSSALPSVFEKVVTEVASLQFRDILVYDGNGSFLNSDSFEITSPEQTFKSPNFTSIMKLMLGDDSNSIMEKTVSSSSKEEIDSKSFKSDNGDKSIDIQTILDNAVNRMYVSETLSLKITLIKSIESKDVEITVPRGLYCPSSIAKYIETKLKQALPFAAPSVDFDESNHTFNFIFAKKAILHNSTLLEALNFGYTSNVCARKFQSKPLTGPYLLSMPCDPLRFTLLPNVDARMNRPLLDGTYCNSYFFSKCLKSASNVHPNFFSFIPFPQEVNSKQYPKVESPFTSTSTTFTFQAAFGSQRLLIVERENPYERQLVTLHPNFNSLTRDPDTFILDFPTENLKLLPGSTDVERSFMIEGQLAWTSSRSVIMRRNGDFFTCEDIPFVFKKISNSPIKLTLLHPFGARIMFPPGLYTYVICYDSINQ
jgi:hypothetical protein